MFHERYCKRVPWRASSWRPAPDRGLCALVGWLDRGEADDQPELHSFAAGIRQDLDAVTAGLTLPYSSGSAEGNVNRLKAFKRQMYGRVGFNLLPVD